jgi:SAM-dependent methyltransferase
MDCRSGSGEDGAGHSGLAHDEEVRRLFDSKAGEWRAKYLPAGALGGRVALFSKPLDRLVAHPGPVLDLGCGTGDLAVYLAENGYEVTAADVSDRMLAEARARGNSVSWVELDPGWTRLPFDDGAFAAVVMSSVLEYVADPDRVISECARLVRTGGVVELTVPDMRHPLRRFERVLQRMLGLVTMGGLLPTPRLPYARYLLLSKNRLSRAAWLSLAAKHALEPAEGSEWAPQQSHRAPLEFFVLRRSAR